MTHLDYAKLWAAESDARIYALKRGGMNDLAKDLGMNPAEYSSQTKLMLGIRKRIRDLLNGDGPVRIPEAAAEAPKDLGPVRDIALALRQCTPAQLREVNDLLRAEWKRAERKAARQWKVGDRVWFEGKRGRVEGTIEALLPKNIRVRQDGGFGLPWRVSPSLLRPLGD